MRAVESPNIDTRGLGGVSAAGSGGGGGGGLLVVIWDRRSWADSKSTAGAGAVSVMATTATAMAPAANGASMTGRRPNRRLPRRMGISRNRYDSSDTARVAATRTANSAHPLRPVRFSSRNRKMGQWYR